MLCEISRGERTFRARSRNRGFVFEQHSRRSGAARSDGRLCTRIGVGVWSSLPCSWADTVNLYYHGHRLALVLINEDTS